ncbi:RNA ligase [uncultured virus]|nr:RNA ligase [uncultured virus]
MSLCAATEDVATTEDFDEAKRSSVRIPVENILAASPRSDPPISAYPHLQGLHHKSTTTGALFRGPVVVQLKIDGSNVSFWKHPETGQVLARSRSIMLDYANPKFRMSKMFLRFVDSINAVSDRLDPRFVYRGEYLEKPRHNCITYDRLPRHNVVLFDLQDAASGEYLGLQALLDEAARIEFDVVPTLHCGTLEAGARDPLLQHIMQAKTAHPSVAGSRSDFMGAQFEGIVVKNYGERTADGVPLMGKLVAEEFCESFRRPAIWRNGPGLTSQLGDLYRNTNRYQKAYQHLRDSGLLSHTHDDIPDLAASAKQDIVDEELEEIKDVIWQSERFKYGQAVRDDPLAAEAIKEKLWLERRNAILKKATSDVGVWYKTTILAAMLLPSSSSSPSQ